MPRIQRGLGDNVVYHVINRGNGRQEVFHEEKDYEAFMQLMQEAKKRNCRIFQKTQSLLSERFTAMGYW